MVLLHQLPPKKQSPWKTTRKMRCLWISQRIAEYGFAQNPKTLSSKGDACRPTKRQLSTACTQDWLRGRATSPTWARRNMSSQSEPVSTWRITSGASLSSSREVSIRTGQSLVTTSSTCVENVADTPQPNPCTDAWRKAREPKNTPRYPSSTWTGRTTSDNWRGPGESTPPCSTSRRLSKEPKSLAWHMARAIPRSSSRWRASGQRNSRPSCTLRLSITSQPLSGREQWRTRRRNSLPREGTTSSFRNSNKEMRRNSRPEGSGNSRTRRTLIK